MFEIKVSGMTCGGCVKSITNALKNMDSDIDVLVDLDKQQVNVITTKNSNDIKTAIIDAGFDVLEISTK